MQQSHSDAGKVTVRDWLEAWRALQVHRPSTVVQVETYFRLHVYPAVGDRQLRALRPSDVQAWVTGRSTVLAPGSVELFYRHFSTAMKAAERDRLISRTPCQGIKLPKKTKTEIGPPRLDQIESIADAIAPRYRAAVVVAAGAGLRLGEVFGMTTENPDLLRRRYRVEEQLLTPSTGSAHLGPTKTTASVRTVALADAVCDELARHLAAHPAIDGFVFTTAMGAPVRRSTFQDGWSRARAAAGAPTVRFHD